MRQAEGRCGREGGRDCRDLGTDLPPRHTFMTQHTHTHTHTHTQETCLRALRSRRRRASSGSTGSSSPLFAACVFPCRFA